jgi:hypothetical protein
MAGALEEVKNFIEGLRDDGVETLMTSASKSQVLAWKAKALLYRTHLIALLNLLANPQSVVTRGGGLDPEEEAVVMKAWLAIENED